jgi:hypothetical protein
MYIYCSVRGKIMLLRNNKLNNFAFILPLLLNNFAFIFLDNDDHDHRNVEIRINC